MSELNNQPGNAGNNGGAPFPVQPMGVPAGPMIMTPPIQNIDNELIQKQNKLLRKQLWSGRFRNLLLLILCFMVCAGGIYLYTNVNKAMGDLDNLMAKTDIAMEQLDKAMDTVDSIQTLTEQMADVTVQISDTVDQIDIDELNNAIDNMSQVSQSLNGTVQALNIDALNTAVTNMNTVAADLSSVATMLDNAANALKALLGGN